MSSHEGHGLPGPPCREAWGLDPAHRSPLWERDGSLGEGPPGLQGGCQEPLPRASQGREDSHWAQAHCLPPGGPDGHSQLALLRTLTAEATPRSLCPCPPELPGHTGAPRQSASCVLRWGAATAPPPPGAHPAFPPMTLCSPQMRSTLAQGQPLPCVRGVDKATQLGDGPERTEGPGPRGSHAPCPCPGRGQLPSLPSSPAASAPLQPEEGGPGSTIRVSGCLRTPPVRGPSGAHTPALTLRLRGLLRSDAEGGRAQAHPHGGRRRA